MRLFEERVMMSRSKLNLFSTIKRSLSCCRRVRRSLFDIR